MVGGGGGGAVVHLNQKVTCMSEILLSVFCICICMFIDCK